MNDLLLKEFLDNRWKELPLEIKLKSKEILLNAFSDFDKQEITIMYNQSPIQWSVPYHANWGRSIRNYLRQEGISDEVLPTKNLDDYYTQMVEFTVGLREE